MIVTPSAAMNGSRVVSSGVASEGVTSITPMAHTVSVMALPHMWMVASNGTAKLATDGEM